MLSSVTKVKKQKTNPIYKKGKFIYRFEFNVKTPYEAVYYSCINTEQVFTGDGGLNIWDQFEIHLN